MVMFRRICPAQGSGEELLPPKQSREPAGLGTGQAVGTRTEHTPSPERLAPAGDVPGLPSRGIDRGKP